MVKHSGDGQDDVADDITHFRSLRAEDAASAEGAASGSGAAPVSDIGDDPSSIPQAPEGLSLPVASSEPAGSVVSPGGPLTADLPVPPAMQYAAGPPVGANERARANAAQRSEQVARTGAMPGSAGPGSMGSGSGVTTTHLWPEVGSGPQGPVAVADAPSLPTSEHTEWVTCPECGEGAMVDLASRRAEDFCTKCDFPLFWARSAVVAMSAEETGASLRRLPGTVGRAATASVACPHCGEPNSPVALVCVRCSQPMVIKPVEYEPLAPEPVYEAPPEPEPEPEPGFPWGWVIAACAAIVIITVVVFWVSLH